MSLHTTELRRGPVIRFEDDTKGKPRTEIRGSKAATIPNHSQLFFVLDASPTWFIIKEVRYCLTEAQLKKHRHAFTPLGQTLIQNHKESVFCSRLDSFLWNPVDGQPLISCGFGKWCVLSCFPHRDSCIHQTDTFCWSRCLILSPSIGKYFDC